MLESDPLIGAWLGQYQIAERLGEGGMARVYKALQPRLRRHVAIKVILPEAAARPGFRERFEREAQLVASLQHANIVAVYDFGEFNNLSYLVMQYVGGGTLSSKLRSGQPMPYQQAINYMTQMARALQHAHNQGVIHRDIKPSNMLLDDKDPNHLLLSDFGIAKLLFQGPEDESGQPAAPQPITTTGNIMGTPEFMAPEQALGQPIDARSDIYSLGLVLYYLLTGQLPFRAATPVALLYQQVHITPPAVTQINPSIPPPLAEVVSYALAKRPEQRYQTAEDFARALESMLLSASQIDAAPTLIARIGPTLPAPGAVPPVSSQIAGAPPTPALTQPPGSAFQGPGVITSPHTPTQVTPTPQGAFVPPGVLGPGNAASAPLDFHTAPTPVPTGVLQPAAKHRRLLPWSAAGLSLLLVVAILVVAFSPISPFKLHQPNPSPATANQTPVTRTVTDDFSVNTLGWQTGNIGGDPLLNWQLGHGAYDIRIPAGSSYARTYFPYPTKLGKVPTNFTIEITVQQVSGSDVLGYGLIVRQSVDSNDTVHGYAFTIDSQGGFQYVTYPSGAQNASFTDGRPAVLAGLGQTNKLKVVVQGSKFKFYANDTLLPGSFSDSQYASGQVGLVVTGDNAEFKFTSFLLAPNS